MGPEDYAQAAAEADADLAQLEGVDPDEFQALVEAGTDRYSDLDCELGDGLAYELRDWPNG